MPQTSKNENLQTFYNPGHCPDPFSGSGSGYLILLYNEPEI